MSFFGVEIQLEVDDGWVVGIEHWEIIKRTRRGEPGPHGIA
jgi:hypothetical protein